MSKLIPNTSVEKLKDSSQDNKPTSFISLVFPFFGMATVFIAFSLLMKYKITNMTADLQFYKFSKEAASCVVDLDTALAYTMFENIISLSSVQIVYSDIVDYALAASIILVFGFLIFDYLAYLTQLFLSKKGYYQNRKTDKNNLVILNKKHLAKYSILGSVMIFLSIQLQHIAVERTNYNQSRYEIYQSVLQQIITNKSISYDELEHNLPQCLFNPQMSTERKKFDLQTSR